jgi:hypothetical protein
MTKSMFVHSSNALIWLDPILNNTTYDKIFYPTASMLESYRWSSEWAAGVLLDPHTLYVVKSYLTSHQIT